MNKYMLLNTICEYYCYSYAFIGNTLVLDGFAKDKIEVTGKTDKEDLHLEYNSVYEMLLDWVDTLIITNEENGEIWSQEIIDFMKNCYSDIIESFSVNINFSKNNAKEIIEIFLREKKKNNYYLKHFKPISEKDFIKEWENNWCRFYSWKDLIDSETSQGNFGLTEEKCHEEFGKSIFKLSSGIYIQSTK